MPQFIPDNDLYNREWLAADAVEGGQAKTLNKKNPLEGAKI